MSARTRPRHRLFLRADLRPGEAVPLDRDQASYLLTVLRLGAGAEIMVFNGRDGEWLAVLEQAGRREAALRPLERLRDQPDAPDLHYLFAPLKQARLDYMAQKAVEMGASLLQPVLTRRTQISRLKRERLEANAIEAAEQCGILCLPAIGAELPLAEALAALAPDRLLVFCDEGLEPESPLAALRTAPRGPLAVLIGPEGGFDEEERRAILARPLVLRLSLGPRILRADTAAVAALALVQATLGDWRGQG